MIVQLIQVEDFSATAAEHPACPPPIALRIPLGLLIAFSVTITPHTHTQAVMNVPCIY